MKHKKESEKKYKEFIAKFDLMINLMTKNAQRRINFLKTYGKTTS